MKLGRQPLAKAGLIILLAILAQSCGWRRTMVFQSPSGKAAIEIWQTRFANEWGTQVNLATVQRRIVVFENRREAIVYFVHVYWSPDETKVGAVITGANILHVAFDARSGARISFDDIRKAMGESIRETYHVPRGVDPIQWAAMSDAHSAFFKLHPELRLSYR